jgi:hypothetical protein
MSNSHRDESYVLININDQANLEYSLDNNDPSVDDETHTQLSYSTLTTTLYSYQDPHQDNDNDHNMNNTILDVELGQMSPIPAASIRAITEKVFSSGVLLYLTSKDLCRLAEVSRYFHLSCNKSYLWKKLLKKDFISYHETENRDDTSSYHSMITTATTYPAPAKLLYIRRYREVRRSFDMKKSDHIQWMKIIRTNRVKNMISSILDLIQFRILVPLPSICLFISMLLYALRLDDRISISVWACGLPLLIMSAYIILCFCITWFLFIKRFESSSIFQQHFYQMRGPFSTIFNDEYSRYKKVIALSAVALGLLLIQLILIIIKLDALYDDNTLLLRAVSWNIIFIPLWLLFAIYAAIPMMGLFTEYNAYSIGFMFVWVPFLIFLVSLASKLTRDPENHIRISLILMPFWLMEGTAMVSSLIYLATFFKHRRLGAVEYFNEIVGVVLSIWTVLSPFVVFQILLSIKDDNSKAISHVDVVTPMLVVLGVLAVGSILIVSVLKTPFEVS